MTEPDDGAAPPGAPEHLAPQHDVLRRLLAYWLGKRGPRRAPARADIDPLEIASLLPHVMLIDVEHAPLRFRYSLVGTEVVRNLGADMTGRYLDEFVRLGQDAPIDYDPLAADPDYLVVGRFARENGLYDAAVGSGAFRLLRRDGLYDIYQRVR